MNYDNIQCLVLNWKQELSKRKRDQIALDIITDYKPLLHKLEKGLPDNYVTDFRQFLLLEILKGLKDYDSTQKCKFNTFMFYRFIDSRKRFMRQWYENFSNKEKEQQIDNQRLYDLDIDIQKVLTTEELMLFTLIVNGKIKRNSTKADNIYKKLKDYLDD